MPQRVFDHRETPLRLIYRRRPCRTHIVGVPALTDQTLQPPFDVRVLTG
ncbi:MAG: Uncharacterised protein [Gammaproteobacteria bacterium]|nr:MAG: Uncharacterised protein [Gammaproteobacteria bacterium]